MIGFNVSEAGKVVNVLPPISISGGKSGQAFHIGFAAHVSIIIQFGVFGAALPTAILVNLCKTAAGGSATAIPFRYYTSNSVSGGGTVVDQLNAPLWATAAGITTALLDNTVVCPANTNNFIVIELDSAEVDQLGDSDGAAYPYVQLQITDSGNVTYASAVAILSGVRQQYEGGVHTTV